MVEGAETYLNQKQELSERRRNGEAGEFLFSALHSHCMKSKNLCRVTWFIEPWIKFKLGLFAHWQGVNMLVADTLLFDTVRFLVPKIGISC